MSTSVGAANLPEAYTLSMTGETTSAVIGFTTFTYYVAAPFKMSRTDTNDGTFSKHCIQKYAI
jgi:hypothetical protein